MKKFLVLFIFCIIAVGISTAFGQSAQDIFNKEEAKAAWHKMDSLIENCSGELLAYYEGLPDTQGRRIAFKDVFQMNSRGRCYKGTHWRLKNESPNGELVLYKVFCTNEDNLFSLRAADDDNAKDMWSVIEVHPNVAPLAENPVLGAESNFGGLGFLRASHSVRGIPLWELWEDANFSLKSVVPDPADSSLVNIHFHWVIPDNLLPSRRGGSPSISPNVEVTLTLNPKSFWRIERELVAISESAKGKKTNIFASSYLEYKLSENGTPYVVKVSSYRSREHYVEKEMPVYVGEITYKSFEPSPEKNFRLAYYGFSEPDFGEKKNRLGTLCCHSNRHFAGSLCLMVNVP
ncbi:MAG: hypothetical protein LBT46_08755 [Planctomycetaceae bacterium]|nr:hypothetical protein [Planctomycetaceae bacterium]